MSATLTTGAAFPSRRSFKGIATPVQPVTSRLLITMNGEVLRQQPKTGSYIENLEQVNFILNISAFQLNIQIKPINPIKITNPGGKDTPQAHHLNSTRILP